MSSIPPPSVPPPPDPAGSGPSFSEPDLDDDDIKGLYREFDALLAIKDPLRRNYRLIQRAKASDIETDLYKQLFETYQEQQHRFLRTVMPPLRWLGTFIGRIAIFSGLVLFIAEADQREDASYAEAWQILNEVKENETASAGRIGVLQTLTAGCGRRANLSDKSRISRAIDVFQGLPVINGFFADCVSLQGLDARRAELPKIDLTGATLRYARLQNSGLWEATLNGADLEQAQMMRARLDGAELIGTSLKNVQLQGASLSNANLARADLHAAKLGCHTLTDSQMDSEVETYGVSAESTRCTALSKTNFKGANLQNADLTAANLPGADLSDTNLTGTQLEQANLRAVNLDGAILLDTSLETDRPPAQDLLTREGGPLLCNTRLNQTLSVDPDRDCDLIPETLLARYPNDFATLEEAQAFVDSRRSQ